MLSFALAAALSVPAAADYTEKTIAIAVVQQAGELVLAPVGGAYTLTDAAGSWTLSSEKHYEFKPSAAGLSLGALALSREARLVPSKPDSSILIRGRRYKGPLVLRKDDGATLTVVNELGVEDYLLGVLPHEMQPDWPVEALKAQAVVARTFAYYNLGKHRREGFDLTADTRAQVYGGVGHASEGVRRAVAETRGEVLGYKSKLLSAFYHAACGGHTADFGAVWGGEETPKPLRGVVDRWCRASPYARWKATFEDAEILASLGSRLIGGPLKTFRIRRRDIAGYVTEFLVKAGSESFSLRASDFRKAVGARELKSLRLFSVKRRGESVEFVGSGSGHGVGLCQWGARLQAMRGRRYEDILRFYFPGSTLSLVDE